jgi:PilZ domain
MREYPLCFPQGRILRISISDWSAELSVSIPEPKRPTRYAFVARVKATDLVSGMQLDGLTSDLSEGGCCVMTRRAPFSPQTEILLQITKAGVTLATQATVIYNLKDEVMGLRFDDMPADQEIILLRWLKAAIPIAHRDRARVP